MLLQSPYGARYDARLREHFDRLVDRISAYEVTALAEGDGFTEKQYEPASIDELLELSTFATTSPSPALQQTVASDLANTAHDIPIPLNERVLAYIELFQGRLRDWIADGLRRGARYLPMIQNVFRAEGLPLDLAYVPLIESAFKPERGVAGQGAGRLAVHGRHGARARPEARLVRRRALGPGEGDAGGGQVPPDARPASSTATGTWRSRPTTAARAGCSARMKRSGLDDFWSLARNPSLLPRETREYVPMILAAIVIARNPAQYGFDIARGAAARLREGDGAAAGRPPARRRMGRHVGRETPGPEPGAAALDDAGAVPGLRAQGARGAPRRRVEAAARRDDRGGPRAA